jgi:hypothetical protein
MLFQTRGYDAFRHALKSNPRSENLSVYTDSEYDTFQVFIHHTGLAGFAITPSGELINGFNNSDIRGLGVELIKDAIKLGANHLNCFDGYLPKLYSSLGFIETSRFPFNRTFAPIRWSYETMGTPDVVNMSLK